MTRTGDKKRHTKANDGPGGIKCNCCRGKCRTTREARIDHNRTTRRKVKAALRGETCVR